MATLTKITRNFQVTIPPQVRRIVKLKVGDFVEATAQRNGILLKPKVVLDRDTVTQRLAEGLNDLKAGRRYGPFKTAAEFKRSLRGVRKQ